MEEVIKIKPIKVLFISRSNPVVQVPNSEEAVRAIEKVEFKVVIDHLLTDTAALQTLYCHQLILWKKKISFILL